MKKNITFKIFTLPRHSGNVGNGVLGTITAGPLVQVGHYSFCCVKVVDGIGIFSGTSPRGELLNDLVAGKAYSSEHLNIKILTNGTKNFIVDDRFDIYIDYKEE